MLAPIAFLHSLIKQLRRRARVPEDLAPPPRDEQRELEEWLFDRDSRWER